MWNRKIRTITLLSMLAVAVSASVVFGYASWQFNGDASPSETISAVITKWSFHDPLPIEPGQTIAVDENGNVTIDGQPVENAEVNYPGNPSLQGGEVTMTIGVDENGDLAVTGYIANDIASNFWATNAELDLPASVSINGTNYPILGLSEPISIDIGDDFLGFLHDKNAQVNIPEGYKYVCDKAFQTITLERSTTVRFNLPSSLEYLGYQAFKLNVRNLTADIRFAGTKAQFKALVDASAAEYGSGYSFFTGASSRVGVICSDGTITYNTNGTYYSGL